MQTMGRETMKARQRRNALLRLRHHIERRRQTTTRIMWLRSGGLDPFAYRLGQCSWSDEQSRSHKHIVDRYYEPPIWAWVER